ncbi:ABC transporter ATP-binding protein [Geodermatophilus sp. YIM 151500]|uniref:metal ABC transporter ATP-binding protein n=1 Tax=Geodermatophilus sp. YIM 151500 TaxID=2984531 RepID=UPI0021E4ACD6|nr:ABC transporter ATP-binding protein [Geodermatophilus sp. YIM 151500]MCV2490201.1 ABC transporter ATP-binding protein [Geodermatophilus sp. YIM 151500]
MTAPAADSLTTGAAAGRPPALVLDGVAVARAGHTVWSQGDLTVPSGSVVGVIGPNGAGKTTLFQVVLGLLPVAAGRVEVLGAPPRRGDRRIGYVPQNYTAALGDAVRCRDLVGLALTGARFGLRRMTREQHARVDAALRRVGAAELGDRRMSELSGGQQQRVAIAQAIVDDAELLLLDEPLANLDLRNQHEVVALLGELRRERDVTIMVVAHDLNPLLPVLTDALYLLDGHPHHDPIGEVVQEDLLTHLYGTPVRVVRTAQGDLFTRGALPARGTPSPTADRPERAS